MDNTSPNDSGGQPSDHKSYEPGEKKNTWAVWLIAAIFLLIIVFLAVRAATVDEPPFTLMESEAIARTWIENESPTYTFDGMNLELVDLRNLEGEARYEFEYAFESRQAGYGDREGEMLAQVITPHVMVVMVEAGTVVRAVTDEVFNEMTGEFLEEETLTINVFFYDPERDMDSVGNIMCSREGLVAVERRIEPVDTPEEAVFAAVSLVLEGALLAEERAAGIETEYPLEGVSLKNVSVADGVATLTFDDPMFRTSGGSCRTAILWFQIEETALQFPEVDEVRLSSEELFQP